MKIEKIFKKKYSHKFVCSICGEKYFKKIGIFENVLLGKVRSIDFSMHCQNDHVSHFKEYINF